MCDTDDTDVVWRCVDGEKEEARMTDKKLVLVIFFGCEVLLDER